MAIASSAGSERLHFCDRPYAMKYAEDQEAFFNDYTKAHLKLSELGESQ